MGVPIALNIGDYLIGLGYQLLGELEADAAVRAAMLSAAAQGHRVLCLGQGAELDWMRHRHPLSRQDVLHIFEQKTSPAFEVALKLGAILAGADQGLLDTLAQFSRYIGQAYQIRDDILDWMSAESGSDTQTSRLSIVKAIALEKAVGSDRDQLMDVWHGRVTGMDAQDLCKTLFEKYDVISEARDLLADVGRQARACLDAISCGDLKVFLRRVLAKILDELGELSCCEDHSPRHD
jgi:geranylgeranyl pyrophosphate synthase